MADFSLHRDFWYFNNKEDKRYCLIFSNWTNVLLSYSISFFDSEDEIKEETMMLNNMYCSIAKPYKKNIGSKYDKKYEICFDDNSFYWGYVIFDFQKETYSCHHDGVVIPINKPRFNYNKYVVDCIKVNNKSDKLVIKDYFLRKPNEIDPNYKFKQGEYEGWLQFRWGDGKNAIGLPQPEDISKEKIRKKNYKPKDKFFKKYEEITESEYIDNGNTLDKKETLFSIGDMIQEDIDKLMDKEKSKYLMDKCGW